MDESKRAALIEWVNFLGVGDSIESLLQLRGGSHFINIISLVKGAVMDCEDDLTTRYDIIIQYLEGQFNTSFNKTIDVAGIIKRNDDSPITEFDLAKVCLLMLTSGVLRELPEQQIFIPAAVKADVAVQLSIMEMIEQTLGDGKSKSEIDSCHLNPNFAEVLRSRPNNATTEVYCTPNLVKNVPLTSTPDGSDKPLSLLRFTSPVPVVRNGTPRIPHSPVQQLMSSPGMMKRIMQQRESKSRIVERELALTKHAHFELECDLKNRDVKISEQDNQISQLEANVRSMRRETFTLQDDLQGMRQFESDKETLQQKIARLQREADQLPEFRESNRFLEQENSRMLSEITQMEKKLKNSAEEHCEVQTRFEKLTSMLSELESVIVSKDEELQQAALQNDALNSELQILREMKTSESGGKPRRTNESMISEATSASISMDTSNFSQLSISNMGENLGGVMEKNFQDQLAALQEALDWSEAEAKTRYNELNETQMHQLVELSSYHARCESQSQELEHYQAENKTFRQQVKQLESDVHEIMGKWCTLQKQHAELQADCSEKAKSLEGLELLVAEKEQKEKELEEQVSKQCQQLCVKEVLCEGVKQELEKQQRETKDKVSQRDTDYSALKQQLDLTAAHLIEKESDVMQLGIKLAGEQKLGQNLQRTLQDNDQKLKQEAEKNNLLEEQLSSTTGLLVEKCRDIMTMTSSLEEQEEAANRASTKAQSLESRLAELQQQIRDLEADVEAKNIAMREQARTLCQTSESSQQQFALLEAQVTESNASRAKHQAAGDDLQTKVKAVQDELEHEAKEKRQAEEKLKKKEMDCERMRAEIVSMDEKLKAVADDVDNYNTQVVKLNEKHKSERQSWVEQEASLSARMQESQDAQDFKDKAEDLEEALHREQERANRLEEEVCSAEMLIAKLEEQVKSSTTFVTGLQESLNVTQLQVTGQEESYRQEIREVTDKTINLESKLDQAHQLIEEWKTQLISLQEKVIAMDEELVETQQREKSLEKTVSSQAAKQLQQLRSQLSEELRQAKEDYENMEEQAQNANNELEAAHATIWGQSDKAKVVDAELSSLRSQLAVLAASLATTSTEYDTVVAGERELKSNMDVAGKELEWYKAQYDQAQDRIEQLEDKLLTSRREVSLLEAAKRQAENRANKLEDDLKVAHDNMEIQEASMKQELVVGERREQDVEEQLERAEAELNDLRDCIDEAEADLANNSSTVSVLREELDLAEEDKDKLRETVSSSQTELETVRTELSSLQTYADNQTQALEQAQHEAQKKSASLHEEYQRKMETLRIEIKDKRAQCANLTNRSDNMDSQLAQFRDLLQQAQASSEQELNRVLEERDSARVDLKRVDTRLQGYVENSQQRSMQHQDDVNKAHDYNNMLQDKVSSLEHQITCLKLELQKKDLELEHKHGAVEEVKSTLSGKENDLSKWKHACEKIDNSLKRKEEQYERELTTWQTKYQNAGKSLIKAQEKILAQEKKLQELRGGYEKYRAEYKRQVEETKVQKEHVEEERQQSVELVSKNAVLEENVRMLQVDLDKERSQLNHWQSRIRSLETQLDFANRQLHSNSQSSKRCTGHDGNEVAGSLNDLNIHSPGLFKKPPPRRSPSNFSLASSTRSAADGLGSPSASQWSLPGQASATTSGAVTRARATAPSTTLPDGPSMGTRSVKMPRNMQNFFLQSSEEEPDQLEWNSLRGGGGGGSPRFSLGNLMENNGRLSELQRRNTLCLPHLKTSYPVEVQMHKPQDVSEDRLKHPSTPLTDAEEGEEEEVEEVEEVVGSSDLSAADTSPMALRRRSLRGKRRHGLDDSTESAGAAAAGEGRNTTKRRLSITSVTSEAAETSVVALSTPGVKLYKKYSPLTSMKKAIMESGSKAKAPSSSSSFRQDVDSQSTGSSTADSPARFFGRSKKGKTAVSPSGSIKSSNKTPRALRFRGFGKSKTPKAKQQPSNENVGAAKSLTFDLGFTPKKKSRGLGRFLGDNSKKKKPLADKNEIRTGMP